MLSISNTYLLGLSSTTTKDGLKSNVYSIVVISKGHLCIRPPSIPSLRIYRIPLLLGIPTLIFRLITIVFIS